MNGNTPIGSSPGTGSISPDLKVLKEQQIVNHPTYAQSVIQNFSNKIGKHFEGNTQRVFNAKVHKEIENIEKEKHVKTDDFITKAKNSILSTLKSMNAPVSITEPQVNKLLEKAKSEVAGDLEKQITEKGAKKRTVFKAISSKEFDQLLPHLIRDTRNMEELDKQEIHTSLNRVYSEANQKNAKNKDMVIMNFMNEIDGTIQKMYPGKDDEFSDYKIMRSTIERLTSKQFDSWHAAYLKG